MSYFSDDDIAHIATPPGAAPVGALRLSGPGAFGILARTTEGLETILAERPARRQHECRLRVPLSYYAPEPEADRRLEKRQGTFRCRARVFLMPAPGSYTREDVAEIHLPGAPALLQAALAGLVAAGARPALPGEFTFRAFRNGRLSLAQAEAVEALVRAGGEDECRQALARLDDRHAARVRAWREKAMDLAARLEAALDFPDEDVDDLVRTELARLASDLEAIGRAAATDDRRVVDGLPLVALVGLSNAGKSSLFNALTGDGDNLVAATPATTRDSLRRRVEWNGVPLLLSDNPGYHPEGAGGGRESADAACRRLGGEDVAGWVLDGSRPLTERDADFARRLRGRVLLIINKADLPARVDAAAADRLARDNGCTPLGLCRVSAVTGTGLEALSTRLAGLAGGVTVAEDRNGRETAELVGALEHCRAAAAELAGPARLELAADDLRLAVESFSRALGEGYTEEALTRIFSRFCIGK